MNSDTRRIISHLNDRRDFNLPTYPSYYDAYNLQDRLTNNPAILVPVLVLVATAVYQATAAQSGHLPSLPQLLWDIVVWFIPARLLFALDGWLNPPLFPLPPMLQQTQSVTRSHAAKSEVLRKLLGVDNGGSIMRTVSQAGRKSLNTLSGSTLGFKGSDHPPGLGNLDNSCYQNSILQGLASLKPFPTYLVGLGPDGESSKPPAGARTTDTLRSLIEELNDAGNNGRTLWTPSVLKNMSTWQQQDAQEYYSKLLDEIDKEIGRAARELRKPLGFETDSSTGCAKDDSTSSQHSDDSGYQSLSTTLSRAGSEARVIRNPLEGLTAQRVACVSCGWSEGLSMIPFNCLTLNLGAQDQHDLYERLDTYTKVEFIEGVECTKCTLKKYQGLIATIIERSSHSGGDESKFPEPYARLKIIEEALEEDDFSDDTLRRCKIQTRVSSTKTKQTVVARPPQSLAIHINRSVFNENTGAMYKNFATVRFPMVLDLGPWCLGSADTSTRMPPGGPGNETNPNEEGIDACSPADSTETKGGKALPCGDEEQWVLDATKSMVAGDLHPSKISGPIYELRAVVTHQGRHENGHYVCYRRHPRHEDYLDQDGQAPKNSRKPAQLAAEYERQGEEVEELGRAGEHTKENAAIEAAMRKEPHPAAQWWRLSDQSVYQVDEETVLAQGGVFMLFYDCIDPLSVLCSEADSAFTKSNPTHGEDKQGGVEDGSESLEQAAHLESDGNKEMSQLTNPPPPPPLPDEESRPLASGSEGAEERTEEIGQMH